MAEDGAAVRRQAFQVEDLRADARPYLEGRAVGAVVLSEGAQAGGSTLAALRSIIHALRGWPTPLGVVLLAGAGEDADEMRLALVAEQVVRFARGQACGNS